MKKILILVNHDIVIYNFRRELVEKLIELGHEVIISSPYGERIDILQDMGCKFIETTIDRHGKNPIKEFAIYKFYKKIIKENKPDVVLTYTIKPNIYGGMAAKKYNVPYIANITGLGTAVEKRGILQMITVILYRISFRGIKTVFFQNEENMQFFIKNNIAKGNHKLIPGSGVNLEQYSLVDYPNSENVEFVFISRIMKEKGIDQYLEAAAIIKKKYPNTIFHVCGFCEHNYSDTLKKYEDSGVIIYHGMINDVRKILSKIHCTVHPSYYPEGISNILLESAATGRPIITTNRSGCREVVDDGKNGYIVEQRNTYDLVNKLENFINLDNTTREKMGAFGREKVERNFDRNIVIEEYLKEIN